MKLTRNQTIIIGIAGFVVLFFVLLFLGVIPGLKQSGTGGFGNFGGNQTELTFWGVSEANPNNAIKSIIDAYSSINTNVRITYREFPDPASYEKALVNALATGQAPDILMFNSAWLRKHYNKVMPIPASLFPLSQFQALFPTVAERDLTLKSQPASPIYSLPLYIDTLAMLYNKDTFDAKAIAFPPATWSDFQNLIPALRESNALNQITKPAAAIGGSGKSIDTASDLLNLLMMQFGAQLVANDGTIKLDSNALQAFNFYLQFSDPTNSAYTWNDSLTDSLDSFSQGQTAIIFNYASQIPLIKAKNPYLNLGVASMPQVLGSSQTVNYANYWGLSVSNQSQKAALAMNFIIYATTNSQTAEAYMIASQKPPALRTLINKYVNDAQMGVFVRQALNARSWPQPDNTAVKQIFSDTIESVLSGKLDAKKALEQAQNEINQLITQ